MAKQPKKRGPGRPARGPYTDKRKTLTTRITADMREALEVLKILNHPVRLSILCNLIEHGEMAAGEIVEQEKELASQSQVSQYLKVLREKGFVSARKDGQFVYYEIVSPEIRILIEQMHELFCADKDFCATD